MLPLTPLPPSQLSSFNTTHGTPSAFVQLNSSLACYGDASQGVLLIPQIGLAMTTDNGDGKTPPYDADVAAGKYDYAISQFALGLRALGGRPALLRIGYEFNGKWNDYGNETFIAAWKRIHAAVRADPSLSAVAFVWDATCDISTGGVPPKPAEWFNPGDDVIDWYGVNVFVS